MWGLDQNESQGQDWDQGYNTGLFKVKVKDNIKVNILVEVYL